MWSEFIVPAINKGTLTPGQRSYAYKLVSETTYDPNVGDKKINFMLFHLALWLNVNPEITNFRVLQDSNINDAVVARSSDFDTWILFGDLREYKMFERWINQYGKWFYDKPIQKTHLPFLPLNGRHNLTFVSSEEVKQIDFLGSATLDLELLHRWIWIVQNCKKPVFVVKYNRAIAFTDDREALHYKMSW